MKHSFYNQQMRRRATLVFFILFYAAVLQAQITINQASYSSWAPGPDTNRVISSFTAVPSNNGTWDLTNATYGAIDPFTRIPVSGNATYPASTYSVPGNYSFNSLLAYESTEMNGLTSTGVKSMGQVIERQPISISPLSGGANDSLVFVQQNIVYTSPENILTFPATAGSTWSSNYNYDLNFELTVAAYGLSNTPGSKRSMVTYTDTVTGWGKMRLKNQAGQNSAYMDVLAIKVKYTQTDSFFLGGAPAPAPLVAAFGLTQGQTHNIYYIFWYRAGEVQPLLLANYSDSTYTTVIHSFVHAARIPMPAPTLVTNISESNRVNVFPNPVTNGKLNIEIDNPAAKTYAYKMINSVGQDAGGAALLLNNGRATIQFNGPAGIYYLNLTEDGQPIEHQKINVCH